MSIWILLILLIAVLSFCTHPNLRRARVRRWRGQAFAHRGLHSPEHGIVENTLPAFQAACAAGCGIELDIQFTADMQVVVYHDDDLSRLAGDPRKVWDVPLAQLQALPLAGRADARIPTLRQALDAVHGQVPLLIELKNGPHNRQLCQALMAHLEGYSGEYLVESFNPLIVLWFRRHAPHIVRGQLVDSMPSYRPTVNSVAAFFMAGLLFNCFTRPDFVAYNINAPRFFSPHFQRFLFRTPMAAWTVRTPELAALVEKRGEMNIFESDGRPKPR